MLFSVGVFVLLDHYPLGRTVYVDADVGGWLLIAFGDDKCFCGTDIQRRTRTILARLRY